ncbi:NAD(P)/FAD-dependent oxidoreductase [Engelhardtia mirabilis]|uniref:Oxidoreductase n=1 Tax=Engelhardtia mirabilis TaxID=2528011 RepID=A0A518BF84_9BACT|nr:Putative oxidoreductase [Planctomycetes bacterium Pla133]QDU99951.1 Putative oxidoreductase [Planctomycetes bacterium Pla86]
MTGTKATTDFDVVVVGAGPAGAATAIRSAGLGHSTLLVDRAQFPRDKVCGSCLHPRAVADLRELSVQASAEALGAVPLERARIGASGRWAELPVAGAAALSRWRLDAALIDVAQLAGAQVRTGVAARVEPNEPGSGRRRVRLGGGDEVVEASLLIAADGLGGALLARVGEVTAPSDDGARVGLGATFDDGGELDLPAGRVDLGVGRSGYVGLVRLEDGRVDLAAAADPSALRAVGAAAAVAAVARECGLVLPAACVDASWAGTPSLTRHAERPFAERALAVGDAAGYVEPFTGEGIAWALASARVTAEHLTRLLEGWSPEAAQDWARAQGAELDTARRRCALVAGFVRHPAWVAALVPVVARSRVIASLVARFGYGRAHE